MSPSDITEATLRADIAEARATYHALVEEHAGVTTALGEASVAAEQAQQALMAFMQQGAVPCASCGEKPVAMLKTPEFYTQKYRETPEGRKYPAEKTYTPPVYEVGCPSCTVALELPATEPEGDVLAMPATVVQVPTPNGRGSTIEAAIAAFNALQDAAEEAPAA